MLTKYLVEEAEGKRTIGRPRRRWADDIKMYLRMSRWELIRVADHVVQ
jgi:hypothetical protein